MQTLKYNYFCINKKYPISYHMVYTSKPLVLIQFDFPSLPTFFCNFDFMKLS